LDVEKLGLKNGLMISMSSRGIKRVDYIDKLDMFRALFKNNYLNIDNNLLEYVYLMVNTETSLIKIGFSKNPEYRERTLHSKEPSVFLIASWNVEKKKEKELHLKYKEKRIRGEWFRLTMKDLVEIDNLMS
jgi:hypothetical protein